MSTPASPVPVRTELFGPGRLATTVGVLLLISLVAFEAMGVGTAMPAVMADIGAVALYAWPFVTFMAAGVAGTALGGRWSDVAGPRLPLLVAPALFGVGLVVAGTAAGMAQLLVGRVLQGLGAGAQGVAVYVLVAAVYPERTRPAVFGMISSAWVLPALVGPPISGLVTERFSWHWVFLGLVPLVLLAVGLVVPAVVKLGAPDPGRTTQPPRRGLVAAALGAAAGVGGLSWASQQVTVTALVVAVVALAVLVPSMRRLLPRGVFRARRGISTVVACRGLLAGGFFATNSFLPLLLTTAHGWSLTMAGLPLLTGSLGWSVASMWQGRHPDLPRPLLLRAGFAALTVGLAGQLLVAAPWGLGWLSVPFWVIAGTGMGLGFSSLSYLLLQQSGPGEVGFQSSAAQMSDQLTTATMIGAGGALLALIAPPALALAVLIVALAGMAGLGVAIAGRTVA
ncbi:MFS transporter [Pseudonocardia sp. GCM10023141]|uniref:MFS transporter n=1 Tax=Pseudonocardia sp. GCM10023141 TaxID=3252653 RepID=UPI0036213189